ncbi:hypothetical protein IFM89_006252 [Coptis chinensis]|uniref:Transposase-associated domain-containing protein n=1 Tax=Coptis chinensis TaxID=261450 RepID=A0A835MHG8_9MAGN|nr:hypothetical protein IFM89_006252 [Coptis chinensis]
MSEKRKRRSLFIHWELRFFLNLQSGSWGKKCPCPCKKCRNRYWLTYKEVGYHLISKGIEKSYRVWTLHGEDLSNAAVHPPLVANIGEKSSDDDGFEMGDTEEETIGDVRIGMRNFVDSAFGLHGDAVAGDDSLGIEFDEPYICS